MKMRSLVVGLMMTACAFAASAEGDWRATLGKVKDLSGDTGITAFFKREAPAYITGRFPESERAPKPNLACARTGENVGANRCCRQMGGRLL